MTSFCLTNTSTPLNYETNDDVTTAIAVVYGYISATLCY